MGKYRNKIKGVKKSDFESSDAVSFEGFSALDSIKMVTLQNQCDAESEASMKGDLYQCLSKSL